MKTTNKILLAMFLLILAGITITLIFLRIQFGTIGESLGSGNVVTEQRQLDEFNSLRVSGNFNAHVHLDSRNSVSIEADDNLMEYVNTTITDNTLVIDFQLSPAIHKTIDINIYVNQISSIETSAGARLSTTDTLEADYFRHSIGSGARSDLLLNVDSLHLESASGAVSKLNGFARTVSIDASGGAQIRATELTADIVQIQASSGAKTHVNVQNKLTANASSGSHIGYIGDPVTQNFSTSGGGRVKPL